MPNLKLVDGNGDPKHLKKSGEGTDLDPFREPECLLTLLNAKAEYFKNGVDENMAVDGSGTPQVFSTTPVPVGEIFLANTFSFYLEDDTAFSSELFAGITALTNGWTLSLGGVPVVNIKTNEDLGLVFPDMKSLKVFGKEDKTLLGTFKYTDFCSKTDGFAITEGNTIDLTVNDDLTGIMRLRARVTGRMIDA